MEKFIEKIGKKNRGFNHRRIADNIKHKYNDTEEAFIKEWNKKYGMFNRQSYASELNLLFCNPKTKKQLKITPRDRMVAATIIQWLGSNCGMCFVETVLKDTGYKVIRTK